MERRFGLTILLIACAGCASTRLVDPDCAPPPCTTFERVAQFDFRPQAPGGGQSFDEFRRLAQPGDLVVTYMHLGRAAAKRQWLFCVLPCGHSLVVLDPNDPQGILECRFHGARRVGPSELELYSRSDLYRLRDRSILNLDRLKEFAHESCLRTKGYDFRSWFGANDCMTPLRAEDIAEQYTCSTFVAAAFHYAGVTLSATDVGRRVITPMSLAASIGRPNEAASLAIGN